MMGNRGQSQTTDKTLLRPGASRLQILLLVSTLASFVSWLAGLGCEATGTAYWLLPNRTTRKLYSTMRTGREALVRRWPLEPVSRWLERMRSLPSATLDQMALMV